VPAFPIIDAHLHIWDPGLIRYPWLDGNALLNRPFLMNDYQAAFSSTDVEQMVFVQCEADFSAFAEEAEWVAGQAEIDSRIRGMVAWAPLEKGSAVEPDLVKLKRHSILRGIRRIIQFEDDIDFCLRPDFIAGVRLLADHGLSFDICIDYRHMANILRFVERLPNVSMILDHIGKPAIRDRQLQPWAGQMRELAQFSNVVCKISGVATEAGAGWKTEDIVPYLDVAFAEFGFSRTMFGGDWPVTLLAVEPARWIAVLDQYLAGTTEADLKRFWRDNAARFYRLET
jgi:L-fuconolactonase